MFGAIASFISGLFKPAADLVDNIHTSDEEKMKLKNKLAQIQSDLYQKHIELEGKIVDADLKIKQAELGSGYWLAATWRPITSIILVGTIMVSAYVNKEVHPDIMELAKVFLGVYTGGRSVEKIAKTIKLGKY